MKCYVIFSSIIEGIGGSMIYQLNKLRYYKAKGYSVSLFHFDQNCKNIIIEDLLQYKNNTCKDFTIHPSLLSQKRRKKVIQYIKKIIGYDNQCELFIESDGLMTSIWGEYVANVLKAKHIVFILAENVIIREKSAFEFYHFKLQRKELFGISSPSTQLLFSEWINLPIERAPSLKAYCSNCLADINYLSKHTIPKSDYTIGTIGRLDKPYLLPILKEVVKFVNVYSNYSFTILLIGGTKSKRVLNKIKQLFNNSSNVDLYITGDLYPIPVELVKYADIYISKAGSAYVSKRLGIPTIKCGLKNSLPISIENYGDIPIKEEECDKILNIQDVLKEALFNGKYPKIEVDFDSEKENNVDFKNHDFAISISNQDKIYYDVIDKNRYNKYKLCLYKSFIFLFGTSFYMQIRRFIMYVKLNFVNHNFC